MKRSLALTAALFISLCLPVPAAVRYVSASSTNPIPPYTSWDTAASVIQDAVDAATDGDEIVVTNGVYAIGARSVGTNLQQNRLVIDKAVEVHSVNGPESAVIQGYQIPGVTNGDGAIRCVYLTEGAVLSGFTITKGATRSVGEAFEERSGAGVYSSNTNGVVTNCVLLANVAAHSGGGAFGTVLKDCILVDNFAIGGGGARFCQLSLCALTNNSAGFQGGGASDSLLSDCTLNGNSSVYYAGGAYSSTLNYSVIKGNTARYGGGVYESTLCNSSLMSNSAVRFGGACASSLTNCLVLGNSASDLGGGTCMGRLENCTVIGNSATNLGGGMAGSDANNCIVYLNTALTNDNAVLGTLNYCCTFPLPTNGIGNITNAPMLADFANGDCHLQKNSPCINAGNNDYVSDSTDLDGNPRILFGTVDMGAYEFQGFTRYVNASNPNPQWPYETWESAATNIQDAVDAALPGQTVLVTNGVYATGGRAVVGTMTNRVVVEKAITVQSVNGPNQTYIVGQGVGEGGTNNGDGAIRCAYVGLNAIVSGFTLTNGHTRVNGDKIFEQSGGGAWCEVNGVITNCVLAGNSAGLWGGGAFCYDTNSFARPAWLQGMDSTKFRNCIFFGNTANVGGGTLGGILNGCTLRGNSGFWYSGGAHWGSLNDCIVTGNTAGSGGGAEFCALLNCIVVGNSARGSGGVYGCALTNCIVYFNSAPDGPNYHVDSFDFSGFVYSCTTPLPTGIGNIDADPLFINTNGWSNLRLQSNSPCINAGNNALAVGSTDLDGNPRIAGGTVDMGAYEFQGAGLSGFPAWLWQHGLLVDGSADSADTDADGINNLQEWRCGTDPTNAPSALRLSAPQAEGANVLLQWQSVGGKSYFLERSTNLSATPPFQTLATNLSGVSGTTGYTDTNPPVGPLFYRIGVGN